MLKCREVAERASAYADGDLPWRARIAMRVHLAMCGPCRRYVSQMLQTIGIAAAVPPEPHDPTEAAQLADRLAALRRTRFSDGTQD